MIRALMAAVEPCHLKFRGEDAAECEAFINAVVRHALSRGKQRDDQWVADFAASCFTQNALRWWNSLDDETQGSWRLLRNAMLSRYRPLFYGRDGEEAEQFVRMVRERALDEGKLNDNPWITGLAAACLAGDALRWHASLDSSIQGDWIKLQRALLAQYPRDSPSDSQSTLSNQHGMIPTPAAAAVPIVGIGISGPIQLRRGRIRVTKSRDPTKYYIGKSYIMNVYIGLPSSDNRALIVDWDWPCNELQALAIHGSSSGYNAIGARRAGCYGKLNLVPMWIGPRLGPSLSGTASTDVFRGWKISKSTSSRSPGFDLIPINEAGERMYAQIDILQKITLVPSKPLSNGVSLFLEPLES